MGHSSKSLNRLLSDSAWSLFGNILSIAGGILLVRVMATMVPTDQYGKASLVLGLIALLNLFFINPLFTAHLRVYFDHAHRGDAASYERQFRPILLLTAVVSTLTYSVIAVVFRLRGNHIYWGLLVPSILLLFATPQATATTNYLEAKRRYLPLALSGAMLKVAQVPILVALLLTRISSATSIVLAQALAAVVVVLGFGWIGKAVERPTGKPANRIKFSTLLGAGFGGALYVANFFLWCVTTSDRYVIQHFLPLQTVGIYAMNYGLWSVPFMVLNVWLDTTVRSRLYGRAAADDWQMTKRITKWRVVLGLGTGVTGTAMLYWVGPIIGRMFLGAKYWHSVGLMMTIAMAHVFYVAGNGILPVFLATKRAGFIVASNAAAAALNVSLNVLLVPRFGILAAALDTLFAYLLWTILLGFGAIHLFKDIERRAGSGTVSGPVSEFENLLAVDGEK